ncbi:paraquat-inducible protein A [Actibacterium ureilyticum]|uniref:paraquat-inducible protein A n=1 Tax=Actibacterium ureilyticum TaxID=1590614 RepID=UPI000BAAB468|nr:paraquat-inducible protein A [Actibacterium ureilyticum]
MADTTPPPVTDRSRDTRRLVLRLANLSLLVLFPVAWFAPLMRAGLLPLFGLNEISVISGLQALWKSDVFLALLVTVFALFAPYLKTIGLALVHFRLASPRILGALQVMGKLAMADVFLIALYIVVAKGVGVGKVETAWGLYLFTACILASIGVSYFTDKLRKS